MQDFFQGLKRAAVKSSFLGTLDAAHIFTKCSPFFYFYFPKFTFPFHQHLTILFTNAL